MTALRFSEIPAASAKHRCGLTLDTILASGIQAAGENEIVTNGGSRLSYKDFGRRVRQLGHSLKRYGIKAESRVAVMERDTHRYLEAYFSVPMLGATLMTVNIRLSIEQIRYTLNHSRTELIIAAAEFLPTLEQVYRDADAIPPIVVIGRAPTSLPVVGEYEELLAESDPSFVFPAVDEDAVATHFYTTGTTGLPKGVTYTHRQLVTHTLAVGFAFGTADDYQSFRCNDVYMPLTPMFHVHAWGLPYVATLLGVKQVYPGRYEPAEIIHLVKTEAVTFSHCVPTIMQMLLAQAEANGLKLPGWKVIIGGSAMSPALAKRAMAADIQVFAAYGMSETCPVISFSRTSAAEAKAHPEKLCRVGHPMPLTELLIGESDESGAPRRGELVARCAWLTDAYFDDPTMTSQLWRDGYLHTGDVAVQDDDGAFHITDRTKDIIKTGGEWLSSLDLEAFIAEHPGVEEVAVVAKPHEKWGERPCAFVKPKDQDADRETLVEGIRVVLRKCIDEGRLPPYAIPDEIHFVDSLPRTSVGKLNKKVLREQVKAD